MFNVERPHLNDSFQAVLIRGHLRMHIAGMKHSRMSGTKLLAAASTITGKPYKRGQYQAALNDIQAFIKENTEA